MQHARHQWTPQEGVRSSALPVHALAPVLIGDDLACTAAQVDVYSFSMIAYQLFELQPPFAGMDPVDAARKAALAEERPALIRLNAGTPTMKVIARAAEPL